MFFKESLTKADLCGIFFHSMTGIIMGKKKSEDPLDTPIAAIINRCPPRFGDIIRDFERKEGGKPILTAGDFFRLVGKYSMRNVDKVGGQVIGPVVRVFDRLGVTLKLSKADQNVLERYRIQSTDRSLALRYDVRDWVFDMKGIEDPQLLLRAVRLSATCFSGEDNAVFALIKPVHGYHKEVETICQMLFRRLPREEAEPLLRTADLI
jgi:hypothetical protein